MTDPTVSDRDVPEPHVPESPIPEPHVDGSPVAGRGLPDPPSKAKLAWATLAALLVAGVVLVATVLPAEYDIDPLIAELRERKTARGKLQQLFPMGYDGPRYRV